MFDVTRSSLLIGSDRAEAIANLAALVSVDEYQIGNFEYSVARSLLFAFRRHIYTYFDAT
jgi:hypothetical protein